jgi:hypothetical protein
MDGTRLGDRLVNLRKSFKIPMAARASISSWLRALSFGRVPILRRKPEPPETRGGLSETDSDLRFSIFERLNCRYLARNFRSRFCVCQKELLFLCDRSPQHNQSAIDTNNRRFGDLLERKSRCIRAAHKNRYRQVYPCWSRRHPLIFSRSAKASATVRYAHVCPSKCDLFVA